MVFSHSDQMIGKNATYRDLNFNLKAYIILTLLKIAIFIMMLVCNNGPFFDNNTCEAHCVSSEYICKNSINYFQHCA